MRHYIQAVVAGTLILAAGANAEQLYKSVNEQGEVTFSDSPPANAVDVEQVAVDAPAPSDTQQQEASERVQRMESQANELGEANAQRSQQRQESQQQQTQKKPEDIPPITDYNTNVDTSPAYPNRPIYPPVNRPPVRPVHPIAPGPR